VLLSTGATIRFRTAEDPDRMRGPNLSGVWLDEASLMDQDAYSIVIGSLREAGEQGWLSATFTPKGPFHWTYETFAKGREDTAIFRAHTRENPFNPPGFADTLAKQYGPQFARQELGGEFVETEGAEWPAAWFPDSLWFHDWPVGRITLRVAAVDPSKGKGAKPKGKNAKLGDYSAIVLLARDANGTLWIEGDLDRRTTDRIVSEGLSLAGRFARETGGALDGLGCESDQFQELLADQFVKQSRALGIMVPLYKLLTGGVPKEVRIRRLTPYLSQGQFRFRDTPGTRLLVQQLQTFPVGDHDDGPDALEYALRLAISLWNGKRSKR
jgi:predicted phage terminase large subunit-like protein